MTEAGVNLVGFFKAEFGQGEVARRLDRALRHAGIPHTTVAYEDVPHRQEHAFEHSEGALHDVNVLCLNAEHLLKLAGGPLGELLVDRYSIGVWFWETNRFPDYLRPALKFVDEIWVASEFVADAIRQATSVPVYTFPVPVEAPTGTEVSRADLGLTEEEFVFSFVFDFHSTIERKNPHGLIEAYRTAFQPEDGTRLLVKSINGDRFPDQQRILEQTADGRSDVQLVDGFEPADRVHAYTALADCTVSLHRSEGFGLTLAEAMASAKPVIATGYSGNLAFMDPENGYLVRYGVVELGEDVGPYPAGSTWAEPDLEHAAALMRRVVEAADERQSRAERGRETIRRNHSIERTAAFLAERLPQAEERRRKNLTSPPPSRAAADFLAGGPRTSWERPGKFGRVGVLYRRLLLRLLRPYTARQSEFEHAVVDALREIEFRLDELERQRRGE